MYPYFNPRVVRVAILNVGGIAAGGTAAFPAPATQNANAIRYIIGMSATLPSANTQGFVSLIDGNGNLIFALPMLSGATWPPLQPLVVPGANNALSVRNDSAVVAQIQACVVFADVRQDLTPELFRS